MADVAIAWPIGSDTADQRATGRALPAHGRPGIEQGLRPFGRNAGHLREHKKEGLSGIGRMGRGRHIRRKRLGKGWVFIRIS
ncbi:MULTISPECIES: hypothetical protein [unclassified Mesorhizobium]|uniref:hypothetical protein n=1 Tax=unclassified Mesorhizobium TaxID=325217 RepID=UPI003337BD9D